MTIDIDGDDILFGGVKVGKLEGGWPTLRQKLIDMLLSVTDRDIDAERAESFDDGYEAGYEAARKCV